MTAHGSSLNSLPQALAEALKCNTSITNMDLSDNEVGDAGAQAQFSPHSWEL